MIYITGDTHKEFHRFGNWNLKKKDITKDDYIIVCGDLGLCWKRDASFEYQCDFLANRPFTLLWVQGNHENYDMINEFPIEEWHGGKVRHIVRDKVILLERGQIFKIEGKTFFTFGGASSHDIQGGVLDRNDVNFRWLRKKAIRNDLPFRILGESWWKEELPTKEEMEEGICNLKKVENKVDYIITHCAATSIQNKLERGTGHLFEADVLTDYLEAIKEKVSYKHWYFGHYHADMKVDEKHTLLYTSIVSLLYGITEDIRTPVIGHPAYVRGDYVFFAVGEKEKCGKIEIVDAYGTFGQDEEPSYDIFVKKDNCLYKHIRESFVNRKI